MSAADVPKPDQGNTPSDSDKEWLDDELVGLDRDDPDVRDFAAHLARMHEVRPSFTVEGYIAGVANFAESANRAEGSRRLGAVLLAALLLAITAFLVWEALHFVMTTWL